VPVEPSGPGSASRDIAAVTYAAHAEKKGLDAVLSAWDAVARVGEELVVVGSERTAPGDGGGGSGGGVRFSPLLGAEEYRALLRRARVFLTAPRREDYGIAQLEALAHGTPLVTTPSAGGYEALPLARQLEPALVGRDASPQSLATALRAALEMPAAARAAYAARAGELAAPYSEAEVRRRLEQDVIPLLLP
jgi:glycosyltransferase involved in cell wall biosynthesis